MKKIIELEVRDDWEPGWCDNCPLGYEMDSYDEDDGYDYWYNCVLCGNFEHCPLNYTMANSAAKELQEDIDRNILEEKTAKSYQRGREEVIEALTAEVSKMKQIAYRFNNTDYETGYISALSTIEGYLAEVKGWKND